MNQKARLCLFFLILAVALAFPLAPLVAQETAGDGAAEEIEEFEVIDDFEIVETEKALGFSELLGRLHPAMVHFPIGWITLLLLLELATVLLGRRELEPAGRWVLALGILGFLPALATGFLRADQFTVSAGIDSPVFLHRNLALLTLLICVAALALRWKAGKTLGGAMRWAYLTLVAMAVLLIGYVGHLGGKMVYGENFLPF